MINYFNHLVELRQRLINCCICLFIAFCILFYYSEKLYDTISNPILNIMPDGSKLIATEVTSTFTAPLKLSFITSFLVMMPYMLYQVWRFVAPGLYKHEKKKGLMLIISSTLLFYLGISFAYFIICPLALNFFANCAPNSVTVMTDINNYLTFILNIMLASGLAFQVPIITILLIKFNILNPEQLASKRKYVIILAFILGMILTPPDVISQILLALPMWGLFEIGVFIGKK